MNCSCGKCVPVAILNLQIRYRTASWANSQVFSLLISHQHVDFSEKLEVGVFYLRHRPSSLLLNSSQSCGKSEVVNLSHGDTELLLVLEEPWKHMRQMTVVKLVLIHVDIMKLLYDFDMLLPNRFPSWRRQAFDQGFRNQSSGETWWLLWKSLQHPAAELPEECVQQKPLFPFLLWD